jgi:hypothetical protein
VSQKFSLHTVPSALTTRAPHSISGAMSTTSLHSFAPTTRAPHYSYRATGFAVANNSLIYPTATGQLHLPATTINLDAFVFSDHDLADNLFGLAPLVNQGLTATFSNTNVSFDAPTSSGSRTILYGTKNPTDNVWYFTLPQHPHKAFPVVRNETQAEIALYAMASFGHPSFRTFHRAVQLGYLSNYPDLTAPMLCRNRPHTPATALGHITASRSNIRSTRQRLKLQDVSDTSSSDSATPKLAQAATRSQLKRPPEPNLDPPPRKRVRIVSPTDSSFTTTETMPHPILENLTQYQPHQLPDIFIRAKVLHS